MKHHTMTKTNTTWLNVCQQFQKFMLVLEVNWNLCGAGYIASLLCCTLFMATYNLNIPVNFNTEGGVCVSPIERDITYIILTNDCQ